MTAPVIDATTSDSWQRLAAVAAGTQPTITELFAREPAPRSTYCYRHCRPVATKTRAGWPLPIA